MSAKEIIDLLKLDSHPEGGFYKETYRSAGFISTQNGKRNLCTSIYYLLEKNDKSNFHRIKSDELWFFHQGQPLELLYIENGKIFSVILGNNIADGEISFFRVPANTWFASRIKTGKDFSLVSCTVSPGFEFMDFELASRDSLAAEYPQLKNIIAEFTGESKQR